MNECFIIVISVFCRSSTYKIKRKMLFDQKTNIDTGSAPLSLPTNYESKVTAPRNPTLNRGPKIEPKVCPNNRFEN